VIMLKKSLSYPKILFLCLYLSFLYCFLKNKGVFSSFLLVLVFLTNSGSLFGSEAFHSRQKACYGRIFLKEVKGFIELEKEEFFKDQAEKRFFLECSF